MKNFLVNLLRNVRWLFIILFLNVLIVVLFNVFLGWFFDLYKYGGIVLVKIVFLIWFVLYVLIYWVILFLFIEKLISVIFWSFKCFNSWCILEVKVLYLYFFYGWDDCLNFWRLYVIILYLVLIRVGIWYF